MVYALNEREKGRGRSIGGHRGCEGGDPSHGAAGLEREKACGLGEEVASD